MIKNYFKVAWRNFKKNKIQSAINLGGLVAGITAVLLIGVYLFAEKNFDNFHDKGSALYRVGFHFWQSGKSVGEGAYFTAPFGADAQAVFPEIQSYTRISSERNAYITYADKTIKLEKIHHADTAFFQLFSFKLLEGDPANVLKEPFSIVLTDKTAERLFGSAKGAIGKLLKIDNQANYTVTGIANEAPGNSHLDYNALISFATLYKVPDNYMDWNGGEQYATYLELKNAVNPRSLEKKLPAFMWSHINQEYAKSGIRIDASLQPMKDIHLQYSENSATLKTNIYVFSIIALLILIISCVNYINLSTAQAITRFKEIGVRKVLGAGRSQLINLFLFETLLITVIAFLLALGLVSMFTPVYQKMIGMDIPSLSWSTLPALLCLFFIVLTIGTIAGSYIAFYLSSLGISRIFRSFLPKSPHSLLRKGLTITQFAITIGLVACTVLVSLQLKFSKSSNPGYDRDQVLVLPLVGDKTQEAASLIQQQLLKIPAVKQVSALSEIPYDGIAQNGFVPEGEGSKAMVIHQLDADEHFLETFNIKMVAGEFFSKDRPAMNDGFIINEALAKTLGWKNPLGKMISRNGKHPVLGVIRDFHFASLHDKIEPLIISNRPWENRYSFLAIKYQSGNIPALMSAVKQTWKSTLSDAPFDYWFLDDAYNKIYKDEERFQQLFIYFSVLSVILSLAGVFGMVALSTKQRTKEFGVRKVLGAGVKDILFIAVEDFIWLIIIATIIITPLSWYYMNSWLENFAYRIAVNWWIFGICGLVILLITLSTISLQTIRAAISKPVNSLRTE